MVTVFNFKKFQHNSSGRQLCLQLLEESRVTFSGNGFPSRVITQAKNNFLAMINFQNTNNKILKMSFQSTKALEHIC